GPIVVVAVGTALGWRNAFFLAAAPGLVAAVLLAWLVREPPPAPKPEATAAAESAIAAWKHRNVLLCVVQSILLVAFVVVFSIFMPLYLVNVRGMSQTQMSWLMSM